MSVGEPQREREKEKGGTGSLMELRSLTADQHENRKKNQFSLLFQQSSFFLAGD